MGLVNEVYENREALMAGAIALAAEIAENPAPAVRGSKRILSYMEDHSVDDGLKYVAAWNSAFLNAREIQEALQRAMEKKAKKG
jgi:enoyl-CoA hydratase